MAKENSYSYTSVFPNYCLTRPKSTFRQNCVSLFPIQTRCTYVNLGLIGNKNGQRKRTQMLLVIRNSHLQFHKSKINIEKELREIISKPNKLQIFWSNHNTEQNFPKNTPAALLDRPYFPLAVWLLDRPRCWQELTIMTKSKASSNLMTIYDWKIL